MKSFSECSLEVGTRTEAVKSVVALLHSYIEDQNIGTKAQQIVIQGALGSIEQLVDALEDETNRIIAEVMDVTPGKQVQDDE